MLLVKKPHQQGTWRFGVDYRRLNGHLQAITNIEWMIVRLGEKKENYFAVLDLTFGYHRLRLLDAATRKFAAFITEHKVQ